MYPTRKEDKIMKKLSQILFPKLHIDLLTAQESILILREDVKSIMIERMDNGEHLKEEPFMPEDLHFEARGFQSKEGHTIEIYEKEGWIVSPMLYSEVSNQWNIRSDKGLYTLVSIDNLYEGIEALRMLGMTTMNFDVVMKSTKSIDKINQIIDNATD